MSTTTGFCVSRSSSAMYTRALGANETSAPSTSSARGGAGGQAELGIGVAPETATVLARTTSMCSPRTLARFQARMAGPGISGPMGSVESTRPDRPLRCLAVSARP